MSLLQDAKIARSYLNVINDKDFAKEFVLFRGNFFKKYHNGLIISNSHGINYFENVVKYWENPIDYLNNYMLESYEKNVTKKAKNITLSEYIKNDIQIYSKQILKDDYEKNFVLILIENKKNEK